MSADNSSIVALNGSDHRLSLVGGKGRALIQLVEAEFPTPDGVIVTTAVYQRVVESHDLTPRVWLDSDLIVGSPGNRLVDGAAIRSRFLKTKIPDSLAKVIGEAYETLAGGNEPVAVRSSATVEDLPDLSFAGQHDSFLNVRGSDAVLQAVLRCWVSLWSDRAIAYRERMGIRHDCAAMAVIIQRLIPANVSGVLFTANPRNGERTETVLNANWGLGETVVGSDVTPDQFVVRRDSLEVNESVTGSKQVTCVLGEGQGTVIEPVPESHRTQLCLSNDLLGQLVSLGVEIEQSFGGVPQDIEWCVLEDQCWILQARPITNLPPPPLTNVVWEAPTEEAVLIRRQVVENMPDPLSPLFEDLYLRMGMEASLDRFMIDLDMALPIEELMERPMFLTVNGYAYCRGNIRMSSKLWWVIPRVAFVYLRSIPRLFSYVKEECRRRDIEKYLTVIQGWEKRELHTLAHGTLLEGIRELAIADAVFWLRISVSVGVAKVTDGLLHGYLGSRWFPGQLTSGQFLRGFPSKTLNAQIELESIADEIRATEALRDVVAVAGPDNLLSKLRESPEGEGVAARLQAYLDTYGHQVYQLDFCEPTVAENPLVLFQGLKVLVFSHGQGSKKKHEQVVQEKESLIQQVEASVGPIRRFIFRKLLGWAERFGPGREESLFYMGAAWQSLRRVALELGSRLVSRDTLATWEDVFFLSYDELRAVCLTGDDGRLKGGFAALAQERRELREARKGLHPPGIIPEQEAWKIGPFSMELWVTQKRNELTKSRLNGFAVSSGQVTGEVSLILSVEDFDNMKPGTILVCPTTTPAWTPLFSEAIGLVTDIGGILAHGSIVAREYGIPAVLGTGNATKRLRSGQRICVDGDRGLVTLEDVEG